MLKPIAIVCLAACGLSAQVKFHQKPDVIDVEIDGKPFTTFYVSGSIPKPFLHPLRAPSGLIITRGFPMEDIAGESKDHPHHRGLWFTHGDINGIDFWMNEAGAAGRHGKIKLEKLVKVEGGAKSGVIESIHLWSTPEDMPLLRENRRMTFYSNSKLRVIDFDVTFTALGEAKFGDTKEGFFAIRLKDQLSESKGTGKLTNAQGATGMKNVWGKPSPWVDYSGTLDDQKVGVAILDNPANFRHPTTWHARDYGLFAVNPFGLHDFLNDKSKDGSKTLAKGESLRFQYRVIIHAGDVGEAAIAEQFKRYASGANGL